jgi:hypothetical protein
MASSGMLRRVAFVINNVSEEFRASFIRVTRTVGLFLRTVRQLLVTASDIPRSPILDPLMTEALRYSETSVLVGYDLDSLLMLTILSALMSYRPSGNPVSPIAREFTGCHVTCQRV